MEEAKIPMLKLGPITFNLTLLAVCIVTIAVIFAFVFWASRQMKLKPEGKQTALEYLISFVDGIGEEHLDHNLQKSYSLLLFTIFLFVAVANNLGLFTKLETVNGYNLWTSPTANLAFDLALSLFITLMVHIEGVRRRGLVAHLKRLATPWPMTPMNLLEEFTNFLSLAIRLFGNIFAGSCYRFDCSTGQLSSLLVADRFPSQYGVDSLFSLYFLHTGFCFHKTNSDLSRKES